MLKNKVQPKSEKEKQLFSLGKEKLKKLVHKMALQRKKAYSSYNFSKKQLNDHMKLKHKENQVEDGKLAKINGRYFQWWEGLPSYLKKFQPAKECSKTLYRLIREALIIDPGLLEHDSMVALMDRYR